MTETKTADETVTQIATDRATRRNELAEVKFGHQGGQLFVPSDGRELMDMANLMSQAGFMVKDIYRGNPGACMGLIAITAPYGLNPLQCSWKTYQTKPDSPISYEAQLIVAMINASGVLKGSLEYEYEGTGNDRRCRAFGTLRNGETKHVWSPPVGTINPKNSPLWKTDPDQQLAYYTGRAWARRHRPEMLLGIHSVDEELPRIGPENAKDVTPGRRGGVSYRDVDETQAQSTSEHESSATEDAEVVDEAAAATAQRAAAVTAANAGMFAFQTFWNGLTPDERSALSADRDYMARLKKRVTAADERIKAEETKDPFGEETAATGDVSGRTIDFEKIASLIARDIAEVEPGSGGVVEETYRAELDAMREARPDLYEPLAEALAAILRRQMDAPFPGDSVTP